MFWSTVVVLLLFGLMHIIARLPSKEDTAEMQAQLEAVVAARQQREAEAAAAATAGSWAGDGVQLADEYGEEEFRGFEL